MHNSKIQKMEKTGYSGTPLAKKLGFKEGFKIKLVNQPEYYFDLFTDFPDQITFLNDDESKKNAIHYFTKESRDLFDNLVPLRSQMESNGMLWISWPKKASKVPTDITEDIIRDLALNNGLVDIKVCAVDEIWSGLKLVIPVKLRDNLQ